MTAPYLYLPPESLERFRATPLPSRVGDSVGRELVVVLVDSVRDGTSGRWRSSVDRLEDDEDDPRPLQAGSTRRRLVASRSSSSTVSHPAPSFAMSSSCSSSDRGGEWDDPRVQGERIRPCGARGCSTIISVSSISCSPQPTFQATYSKRSKRRALRIRRIFGCILTS